VFLLPPTDKRGDTGTMTACLSRTVGTGS
jgi:hypothetical protein